MFVTNHVLSGVVVGRLFDQRPVTAFVAGVVSHLALDMVPHWGCKVREPLNSEVFLRYAKRDGLLGLVVAACAIGGTARPAQKATLAAVAGAVILDADKPLKHFFGYNPFPAVVQRIHSQVQNESTEGMPNEIAFGLSCAIVDVGIAVRSRRRRVRVK